MDDVIPRIISLVSLSDRASLSLVNRKLNFMVERVGYKSMILAEQCCSDGNLAMFLLAVEQWKQPLLKRYYIAAIKGKSLEIVKYLHSCNVKAPKDTLCQASRNSREIYDYIGTNFPYCDRRFLYAMPGYENSIKLSKDITYAALDNWNLDLIKKLHYSNIEFSYVHIYNLFEEYNRIDRKNRTINQKNTIRWLIEVYGFSYAGIIDDLDFYSNVDLIIELQEHAINILSARYKINLSKDMTTSEIISELPINAYKDCAKREYVLPIHDADIMLFLDKYGVDFTISPGNLRPKKLTVEHIECICRHKWEIYYLEDIAKMLLSSNYEVANKYIDDAFSEVRNIIKGNIDEMKKLETL